MMPEEKRGACDNSPTPDQITGTRSGTNSIRKRPHAKTKNGRMLRLMLGRGKAGLNSQDARLKHGDGCLHSTVSAWQSSLGIEVSRQWVTVLGWSHEPTRVMRYWFDEEAAERVRELIKEGRA